MKKSMLATLLLAGVMSFGLMACGKDDDGNGDGSGNGNQGGSSVVGEQVTADQWTAAWESADVTYVVCDTVWLEKMGDASDKGTEHAVFAPNIYYGEETFESKEGTEVRTGTYKDYEYVANGTLYNYYTEGDEEPHWTVGMYELETFDFEDTIEYWEDVTGEYFPTEFADYTYDSTKSVYYVEKSLAEGGVTVSARAEVTISGGKVYSFGYTLTYAAPYEGTTYETSCDVKVTFKSETITLPAQDELNALIASNSGNEGGNSGDGGADVNEEFILGTYKFYSMTVSGSTSSVENGMSEDYISVGINANHTMYYSIMNNEALVLDWEIVGDNLQCSTGGTPMMTFEIRGGELVMHSGSDIMVLVKKSNKVNPDDFNLGGNGGGDIGGGDVGGGSTPGEPVKVAQYFLQSVELGGETYYVGDEFYDEILTETYYSLEFFSDGTAIYYWGGKNEEECTWNKQGNTIILEGKNLGTVASELNGDVLIMDNTSNRGAIITFVGEGFDVGDGKDEGGNGGESKPEKVAQYFFESFTYSGQTYYVGDKMLGVGETLTETYYKYTFFDDGTAIYVWAGKNVEDCTWYTDGNAIVIEGTSQGSFELTFENDRMIMSLSGAVITFVGEGFDVGDGGLGELGSYVGTYKFYCLEMYQGETYYVGDYFSNMNLLTQDYYSIVLNADGTASGIWQDTDMGACVWDVVEGEIVIKTVEGYDVTTLKMEGEYFVEEYRFSYKAYLEKVY